ncbi:hypothetical protein TSUD_76960 [Trifolium subterraneum]|uniref:Uncharacterized protein n=1 Tax=Trifolium subterraneum TaxID=3900 RepID=A0A2Z6LN19_TRISU|nr:hypothetical protein TSUD_76960 [Trifolium subterraneum]
MVTAVSESPMYIIMVAFEMSGPGDFLESEFGVSKDLDQVRETCTGHLVKVSEGGDLDGDELSIYVEQRSLNLRRGTCGIWLGRLGRKEGCL